MDSTTRTPLGDYVPVALIKLVLHPLLLGLLGLGAISLGLPLQRFTLTVVVMLAALPSASNVAMLAERFGADNGRIARIILLSTVRAFFYVFGSRGVAHLMVPQGGGSRQAGADPTESGEVEKTGSQLFG